MNEDTLKKLLNDVYSRKTTPQKVLQQLKTLPYENIGFACLDHHRTLRTGVPEVIYCEGKSPVQISLIVRKIHASGSDILATRLSVEVYNKIKKQMPAKAKYNPTARTLTIHKQKPGRKAGSIMIVTAGTSDIPVAEEAAVTADLLGSRVEKIFDVGVAGIHRLLDKIEHIRKARVVVVVAGMDGALASAVPTQVGYGSSFKGIASLLSMLNSCATGLATVNIDNGFGAGCLAHKINLLGEIEDIE